MIQTSGRLNDSLDAPLDFVHSFEGEIVDIITVHRYNDVEGSDRI